MLRYKEYLIESKLLWQDINDNHEIGNNIDEISNRLDSHRDNNIKLSSHEKEHLYEYSNFSKDLNESLLKFHKQRKRHPNIYEGYNISHLDSSLKQRLPNKLNIYSGVSFNPNTETNSEGILHLPAYTSSSIDKNVAAGFSKGLRKHNAIIHFHLEPNESGLYLGNLSSKPWEHEFILPRDKTIQIHNRNNPDIVNIKDDKGKTDTHYIYHAKILKV